MLIKDYVLKYAHNNLHNRDYGIKTFSNNLQNWMFILIFGDDEIIKEREKELIECVNKDNNSGVFALLLNYVSNKYLFELNKDLSKQIDGVSIGDEIEDKIEHKESFERLIKRLVTFGFDINKELTKNIYYEMRDKYKMDFVDTGGFLDMLGQSLLCILSVNQHAIEVLLNNGALPNNINHIKDESFTKEEITNLFKNSVWERNIKKYLKGIEKIGNISTIDYCILFKRKIFLNFLDKKGLLKKTEEVDLNKKLNLNDLVTALKTKDTLILENILQYKEIIEKEKIRGKHFIFFVIEYGYLDIVKKIIENNLVSINEFSGTERTDAFYWSVNKKKPKITEYLLKKKWISNSYFNNIENKRFLIMTCLEKNIKIAAELEFYNILNFDYREEEIKRFFRYSELIESKEYKNTLVLLSKNGLDKILGDAKTIRKIKV